MRSLFAGWGKGLTHQPQVPTLRSFGLGLLALLLVIMGLTRIRAEVWLDALVLVGGGLLLWLWRFGDVEADDRSIVGTQRLYWPRWWAGGLLAAAALGVAVWRWRRLDVANPTDADWLWYLAGVGLLLLGAAVMERWSVGQWRRWVPDGWALLAIVLLGAFVRLVALDSLPFGTWYDEAANGLEALRMVREAGYQPIYTDGVNATGHYLWLIVGAFQLFGETTFAVRSISALMGIATVIAAYWAGRELQGRTLGLIFALLIAVARWSITFSRLGMYNSATPLFELLALFWLLRGWRRGSVLDFTLAGVAIGLGLCFYSAFQLFLGVIGIFVLVAAWQERGRWRVLWGGLAISALAAALVVAPLIKYVLAKPESYFARVQATSLFADKAPEERIPALWKNTRKHLLMFNVRGDPNGRHNLPGEPMLDWVSSGLMVVGVVSCLRSGSKPRALLIPVWIAVGLMGGILSLDFEAPQSLRAIGALPAVLLCAALPVAQLVQEWGSGAGRYFPRAGFGLVAVVLLLPAGVANLHTYFVRQANDFASWNAHSTPETIAAHLLRDADPAVEKYVISLFDGHPTVRFLAGDVAYRRVETNTTLPLVREMPNGMMLVVDTERQAIYEESRRLYATGNFQEIRPPFGGPVVVYVTQLSGEDLQTVQGLWGTYSQEVEEPLAQVRKDGALDFEWPADAPVQLPFVADWRGVLAVNSYGPYQFFIQAPGEVALTIGESVVIEGDASNVEGLAGGIMLARGHHAIHLHAEGGEGRLRLAWQPPDGPPATVPGWALYVSPVQSNGLLGRYFANGEWNGEPAFAQIDPRLSMYFHVPTLARPYTVEWSGKLATPAGGYYDFTLQSIDDSVMLIDGKEVVAAQTRNEMSQGGLTLEAGLHDIVVRYGDRTDHSYINLQWRPPGSDQAYREIPSELLFPPQERYEEVDVADLARFVQSEVKMPTEVVRNESDPARVDVVASGLATPRGVAVYNGVVYVGETGNRRVLAFDAATGELRPSPFDSVTFSEPFDLAVQADGTVIVLDAGSGQLMRYVPGADRVDAVPTAPDSFARARGLGAGLMDEVWVANTPGQKVVAVDGNGAIVREVMLPAVAADGKELQPVDVAVLPDNSLYVTDVGGHMLYRFSMAGYLVSSQPIPVANSLDSAHLAVDGAGALYLSEPEAGRVVRLDANGIVDHVWNVRAEETPDAKPIGIAVAADGTIWVADSQGGRLLRVTPESGE
ncbi:MAG: glycosyltransferase family 39 protein [Caldilineaceae bacterium]|nr:glycosyltransferase family 39 protein [Caldilineaceae bacterium]